MLNVLLIERARPGPYGLASKLIATNFNVHIATDASTVLAELSGSAFDLIIQDLDIGGLAQLETIIGCSSNANILLLASRKDFEACLKGLNMGADDYLVKPILFEEVMYKIDAIVLGDAMLKSESGNIQFGDLFLDDAAKQVLIKNTPLKLTPSEYKILELLLKNQSEVLSHQRINKLAREKTSAASKNSTEAHICTLRRKLNKMGMQNIIRTHRGFGYVIRPQL